MTAPAFILLNPQLGENIGAVARAMSNFGLTDLRIVAPRDGWPNPAAVAMAAHGENLIENAIVVETLKDALTDITTLYATTPRQDVLNKKVLAPKEAMTEISGIIPSPIGGGLGRGHSCSELRESTVDAPLPTSPLRGEGTKTAILFGAERAGLSNEDIVLADGIISIPVSDENPSLNLAQAAVVIAYEWFISCHPGAGRDPCKTTDVLPKCGTNGDSTLPSNPSLDVDPGLRRDDIASKAELEGLFEHAKILLDEVNYFREPNRTKLMWQHLRSIWVRSNLTAQEVKTLRGLIRAILRKM